MKKFVCVLLAAVLCVCMGAAMAEEDTIIDDTLFETAKETVSLISYGEYTEALTEMGLPADEQAVASLKKYIDGACSQIYAGTVQRDVAVAWYDTVNAVWYLAVPFEAPSDAAIGALVFSSLDGKIFNAYQYAQWGAVSTAYAGAENVLWNLPYEGDVIVVEDDQ